MTSDLRATQIIDDLDAALRGPLGVRPLDRLDAFVAAATLSCYLREPRLTIALHFDIQPAFLILDPRLGTLGIVELVTAKSDETIGNQVRRCIDRATYMRHLLLRDRTPGVWRPITVELVLLTADQTQDEKQGLNEIGVALRDVFRDTNSLFHIGVGILCHGGPNARFEGRLRRAFPWLLTATRRWLASPRANSQDAPARSRGTLRRLTLTNYRLPGVRDITLADARVHLVHGPNGSGKSSIAEALEIVTSGKVERLEEAGEKQCTTR